MTNAPFQPNRSWAGKFRDAFRGLFLGTYGQSSFAVHISFTVAVTIAGFWFGVSLHEWCLLVLSIALVLVSELINSGVELLARAIDPSHNPLIRDALDITSGAVLLAALGASAAGLIIFVPRLVTLFGG